MRKFNNYMQPMKNGHWAFARLLEKSRSFSVETDVSQGVKHRSGVLGIFTLIKFIFPLPNASTK